MTIRRTRRVRSSSGRGPRKPPDERKDYLIQARVPRELDDMLKQDAKRRRLSVSHLIRNVLEDTYKLVDGVISDVDTIVQESVELTGRMRRDAREIARSAARVREAHAHEREAHAHEREAAAKARPSGDVELSNARTPRAVSPAAARLAAAERAPELRDAREPELPRVPAKNGPRGADLHDEPSFDARIAAPRIPARNGARAADLRDDQPSFDARTAAPHIPARNGARAADLRDDQPSFDERTADIYAWNPVVLNRPAHCERCDAALSRGDTGHLGLSQNPASTPRWLCGNCLASL